MNHDKLTPMLKQYMEIKQNTNDALVFYRLGDFYELFFEDAVIASKVLDLVLTSRSAGGDTKAPMCGVPHHAARSYIQKLVNSGYKVAIVEQLEDPKSVKGIVKRDIVEIVTPGTNIDSDDNEQRSIAALSSDLVYATLVISDLVSGSMQAIRILNQTSDILKTLQQFQVKELVVDPSFSSDIINEIEHKTGIYVSQFSVDTPKNLHSDHAINKSYGLLLDYLESTQKKALNHLDEVRLLNDQEYLKMDYPTMTNLELIDSTSGKQMSLYRFLNKTITNMGSRTLKDIVTKPLVSISEINKRHQMIEVLHNDFMLNQKIIDTLKDIYDLQKIVARIATDKHNAQDLHRLATSLKAFNNLQEIVENESVYDFISNQNSLIDLRESLLNAIRDDAPIFLKDGKTFKKGINSELDELLELSTNGKQWLLEYEAQQREVTGIKNLKVSYTRAFGYYIEISKGQIDNVKDSFGYIRKQTLTNAERYISEALQDYEIKSNQASDRISEIENELFNFYTNLTKKHLEGIQNIASSIAYLDVIVALASISIQHGFTKPEFVSGNRIEIKEGMHPVLQHTLREHQYISSDVNVSDEISTLILTGPNMGGKSTYMRMVALNVILAQIGCYVPCSKMTLSPVDQIFTRMGASDDILMGQSTFMVEMMEAQNAITNATDKSLILFDEIGRGTSTYDGMALAQAIIEYIHSNIKCRTIFSTHYHELVTLEAMYQGIKNIHVEVHEENDHVTFLYKVIEGRADRSYGINVARLAHLPESIISRAQQNLERLELTKSQLNLDTKVIHVETESQSFIKIKQKLGNVNLNAMTPLESLTLLHELQSILLKESNNE